jgi:hypothetical protein
MLRIPHCLDNRLTDGGKVVSLTHPLSKPQGVVRPEGLGKFKNHLIGYRTRDFPVCSILPYPLRYRVPPLDVWDQHLTAP